MAGPSVLARARARITCLCESDPAPDALALRLALLDEVRRAVAFDAHVWLLTDPETWVGTAPLADIPPHLRLRLPELIRLKYLTVVNRWTALAGTVRTLAVSTGGDRSRSRLWHELLGPEGVTDIASMSFVDRFGSWGFLDLWRTAGGTSFTSEEVRFLEVVREPITSALRRAQAATFALIEPSRPRRPEPVVLLLGPGLDVLGQTPSTHEYLRVLVPTSDDRSPVPASAYNVAAQVLALEAGVDQNPPWARVHLGAGRWLTLRAARLDGAGGAAGTLAVTIEEASPAERLAVFCRAVGLSTREQELVGHLSTGAGTREVAARMFLSEYTVHDHLRSVFAKSGVRTRGALLARARGG